MEAEEGTRIDINQPGIISFGKRLPTAIALPDTTEHVVHLSSGGEHSVIVCASGHVYTVGWIEYHGWMRRETALQPTPVTALDSVRIVQAACSSRSTYFLTDVGLLYSCGRNNFGQLGIGDTTNNLAPVPVQGLPVIKKVAAGGNHVVVLTVAGEIWSCGHNSFGQLGLGHTDNHTSFSHVSDLEESATDVSCGAFHTALLTASGRVLVAGSNDCCQLGVTGMRHSSVFLLACLPPVGISSVSCGHSHTVALAMDGRAWAWGLNDAGQLGDGRSCEKSKPTCVLGPEGGSARIFAGFGHTALVTHRGDVYICGRGRSGELGTTRGNVSLPTLLRKLPQLVIEQVVFGGDYSLLSVSLSNNPSVTAHQPAAEISNDGKTPVTDLERAIIQSLQCPNCSRVMHTNIHLCMNGHSLCANCFFKFESEVCPKCFEQFIPGQNNALQCLAAQVLLPCSSCLLRMPVSAMEHHSC